MTQDQFRARFAWTVDSVTGCWTDLRGPGAFRDPTYPARVHVYRSEGAPPMKHGGHSLMQRANRLAYETFIGPTDNPPHATCGNRACFNPEHLEPQDRGSWRRTDGPESTAAKLRRAEDHRRAVAERKASHEAAFNSRREVRDLRLAHARHVPESIEELITVIEWDVNENACWVNVRGRGVVLIPETGYYAMERAHKRYGLHRLVYTVLHGPIAPGQQVCHHCDNPGCINPLHLFAGTRSDNTQDMIAKGRVDRSGKRVLTEDQVLAILESTESSYKLGPMYGLTPTQIRRIKTGRRWGGVYARWRVAHAFA